MKWIKYTWQPLADGLYLIATCLDGERFYVVGTVTHEGSRETISFQGPLTVLQEYEITHIMPITKPK